LAKSGIESEKSRDLGIPIEIKIQGNFAVTDLKTKSEKYEILNENFQLSRKHAVFIRIKFLIKVFQILETKKLSNYQTVFHSKNSKNIRYNPEFGIPNQNVWKILCFFL
jgi:hypothetical protein